jgi:hypothetical protein
VAYRDESNDAIEAQTSEGLLRLEVAPRSTKLTLGVRTIHVAGRQVTLAEQRRKLKRDTYPLEGRLTVARDVPHEDLGLWLEAPSGMRRIFGVEPVSLLEPEGLDALASLDKLANRLRTALSDHAGDIVRAVEIGRGLDKVLVADHGDRYAIYARRLFRDRAQLAMTIHDDGRVILHVGKKPIEITIKSRFGITVVGDYLRFAAADGTDLARISIPWIAPEDRRELARRIGQLVDATPASAPIAHPYL